MEYPTSTQLYLFFLLLSRPRPTRFWKPCRSNFASIEHWTPISFSSRPTRLKKTLQDKTTTLQVQLCQHWAPISFSSRPTRFKKPCTTNQQPCRSNFASIEHWTPISFSSRPTRLKKTLQDKSTTLQDKTTTMQV